MVCFEGLDVPHHPRRRSVRRVALPLRVPYAGPYIPSPLVVDGVVWLVEDGIVTTLDAESGERLHRGRLTGGGADVYASPVAAGGHVYVGTLDGDLAVLEGGGTWTVAKVNELGEEIHATPAVVGDALYLRTKGHLYRFGSPASPATTAGADAP